jgi:hypothetical protein
VQSAFHLDVIQGLISRYASEPFELAVDFGTRDGQKYPVVVIPEGVRTPVAVKRDLLDPRNSNRPMVKGRRLFPDACIERNTKHIGSTRIRLGGQYRNLFRQ